MKKSEPPAVDRKGLQTKKEAPLRDVGIPVMRFFARIDEGINWKAMESHRQIVPADPGPIEYVKRRD